MNLFRPTLIALVLIVAAPVAAQADKTPKPKPPKIFITLTDGAMNKTSVVVPVTAAFAPPKGTKAAAACKGKVSLSAPIGKKTVKKRGKKVKVDVLAKKSAKLTTVDARCSATGALALPSALIGTKVKFTAKSKGNSAVKAFSKSTKLLVTKQADPPVPAAPPVLKPGPWTITENFTGSTPRQWGVTIGADNTLTRRMGRYGTIAVHCPGPHADRVLQYSPAEEAPFDDVNVISTNPFTAIDRWQNPSDSDERATQQFTLNFTSPTSATGTFQITGTFRVASLIAAQPDPVAGCASDVIQVHMEYGAAA